MEDLLWFNGQDAHDLGFILEDAPDLLGAGANTPQVTAVPQAPGVLLASVPVSVAPRTLRLIGHCSGATIAAAKIVHDRIASAVGSGLVEIKSAWDTALVVRGVLITHAAGPNSASWLGRVSIEVEFLLVDPYAYAINPSTIAFGSTPVAIPLGTAPSRGREGWSAIITIAGAATTPMLTEYDATGTALRTMAFTSSPTATDAIEIDLGRGLVTAIASSVRSNGYANLTAGFEFPRLDPADGDWYANAFPMLAVSSGSGSVFYYKGSL